MFQSIIDLFFPKVCYACYVHLQDYEQYVCTSCRHSLPVTNYHFNANNAVEKVFYGREKVEQATALLRFEKKSIVQQLIHNLKYRGYEEIGVFLGQWLGNELKEIAAYNEIDIVIPVPLHKKKLKKRGYNQVAKFGQEIAKALQADYNDASLIKITNTTSQVTKKRFARWQTNYELFALQNASLIENKHVLIVDDIITTGATLESCIQILNKAKNVKISIATMAIVQ
ncbi:ComF family protein [Lacinutrix sp. C3R15]|uniref:ComF family protein n=1 Tax=Flavobacteriaceae TaxID=49546 RepID=UPI001C08EC38|nr:MULTISPECIES: phosphoribosyltransferase family protein [Flavobacteriaceae]MBU2940837.1 ComF family protein [Lacinutrix sp. C3R15]MDO6624155.1 phosphoribosyltransferase family protein [Oceanihabitans sp. 1_MG-2023]